MSEATLIAPPVEAGPVANAEPAAAPAPAKPARLEWIDVTRGVAIIGVLHYHTLGILQMPSRLNGQAGVDAFLFISGFGLAYATRPEPWHRFLGRRLAKLIPAYWLVLALCLAFEWYRGAEVPLKQVLILATCTNLIAGDPYVFAVNMSFWFMGLIVPLYLWFTLVRPWLAGRWAYAALGGSIAVAFVGSILIYKYGLAWGGNAIGHAPHRVPVFFFGAVAGVAFQRREPIERLTREPMLLLALVLLFPVCVWGDWPIFPFSLTIGLGVIAIAMLLTSLAERWRVFRPLTLLLIGVGAIAFELYLVHQYLLTTVNTVLLWPRLSAWFPKMQPFGRLLMSACLSLAAAVWLAWLVRWAVAWRDTRKTWRATLPVLAVVSGVLVLAGTIIPAQLPRIRPRTFELAVTLPVNPPAAYFAEPVVTFGHHGAADMVYVEHDGKGLARIAVAHWGASGVRTDWVPVGVLTGGGPWRVTIDGAGVRVRAAGLEVRTERMPHVPTAKPQVGRNDAGFNGAVPATMYLRVERLNPTTGPATEPTTRPATAMGGGM